MSYARDMELSEYCFRLANILTEGKPGYFLEVGAHNGINVSNTVRLEEELGWRGILIEPSAAFDDLVNNRSAKNIFVHSALVGDEDIHEISGLFNGDLTDSADPDFVHWYKQKRQVADFREHTRRAVVRARKFFAGTPISPRKQLRTVPASTLSSIIAEAALPSIDLFSLDVEGYELQAMQGFNFELRPRLFVVETRVRDAMAIAAIFLKAGYVALSIDPPDWEFNTDAPVPRQYANVFWLRKEDVEYIPALLQVFEPALDG